MRVALLVAYDGTGFEGFQRQRATRRTVQGVLEGALATLLGQRVVVRGASRTDSGVHAWHQVCDVAVPRARVDPVRWPRALAGLLAPDVAVLAAAPVPDAFDARRDAIEKTYRYLIHDLPVPHPLLARVSWHVPFPLDDVAMGRAAAALAGRHDFRALRGAGGPATSTVRTIHRVEVVRRGRELGITCAGSGFLYHMVRTIVGTLVEVGRHRLEPQALEGILASGERARAGPTAPARGLHLVGIRYDPDPFPGSAPDVSGSWPHEPTEEERP